MNQSQDFSEKREFVRASLTFDVKFRVVDKEEYELSQKKISQLAPEAENSQYIDGCMDAAHLENAGLDRELINFLIHLNDKLDTIMAMISRDTSETIRFHKGTAVDIGGAGMRMAVDNPVQVGEFVHIQLVLSRTPVMHIDVYGQVVRVDAPFGGCGDSITWASSFRIWMSIPGKRSLAAYSNVSGGPFGKGWKMTPCPRTVRIDACS